jgi:outer membrane protein OmpA-like peptidoglycan-associated protein
MEQRSDICILEILASGNDPGRTRCFHRCECPDGTERRNQGGARFLVYFDEFSAFLSNEAKTIIADAAKRARETGAHRIVVQARASATGTAETNKYLAQTRSSIVTDQLEADGIARAMVRQEPIGQTGSNDPTVTERRVDIILEP